MLDLVNRFFLLCQAASWCKILPKDRADYIYCIRAMGHQENKICPSKASEVYRPEWCSISALTSRCYTVARCIILVVALLVLDNCLRYHLQCETTASRLLGSCLALQKTSRHQCCNYSHLNGQLSSIESINNAS